MTTAQNYSNEKRENVELWLEETKCGFDFWEKTNGISESITKRQYKNRVKKYNLSDKAMLSLRNLNTKLNK